MKSKVAVRLKTFTWAVLLVLANFSYEELSLTRATKIAVEILSGKVKAFMLDLQKWRDKTDLTIQWLNSTFHNQTSVYTYIRQLEFVILLLQMQVRELLDGVESSLDGKLSLNLIPPEVLMRILKNVTFFLPEGYSLFAGPHKSDMHLYYEY
jgi:hypothetical protein